MKRPYPHRMMDTEQLVNACSHLICGFVRKGNGKDVLRPGMPFLNKVRDTMRYDARFSASCPGKNEYWSFFHLYCFLLLGIQMLY